MSPEAGAASTGLKEQLLLEEAAKFQEVVSRTALARQGVLGGGEGLDQYGAGGCC